MFDKKLISGKLKLWFKLSNHFNKIYTLWNKENDFSKRGILKIRNHFFRNNRSLQNTVRPSCDQICSESTVQHVQNFNYFKPLYKDLTCWVIHILLASVWQKSECLVTNTVRVNDFAMYFLSHFKCASNRTPCQFNFHQAKMFVPCTLL